MLLMRVLCNTGLCSTRPITLCPLHLKVLCGVWYVIGGSCLCGISLSGVFLSPDGLPVMEAVDDVTERFWENCVSVAQVRRE